MGYMKGSTLSLLIGLGCGAALCILGLMYMVEYRQSPEIATVARLGPLGITLPLAALMTYRYATTSKLITLVLMVLSAVSSLYYVLRFAGIIRRTKKRRR